jgi:hypothetical protein
MMTYTDVKTAQYANAEGTAINCFVKFAAFPDYVPFTASKTDVEEHGRQIYDELISGGHGTISAYVAPSTETTST